VSDSRVAETFTRLDDIMARLRGPGGCPWDHEQTPQTLRPYLLEEVYEVLEALDRGNAAAVRDELGDLLLQIVFQSQLAAEEGHFTIADVATAIAEKLVRRHPHVFGDVQVRDAQEVVRNWGRIKAEERRRKGEDGDFFAGVPAALPALLRAQQLGEKAAHVGLDWTDAAGVLEKVREEQRELETGSPPAIAPPSSASSAISCSASRASRAISTSRPRSRSAARTTGSSRASGAWSQRRGSAARSPRRSTPPSSTGSGRPPRCRNERRRNLTHPTLRGTSPPRGQSSLGAEAPSAERETPPA
jgi:NTP pyrophosphatase (non-canonical NTP hydrolase)